MSRDDRLGAGAAAGALGANWQGRGMEPKRSAQEEGPRRGSIAASAPNLAGFISKFRLVCHATDERRSKGGSTKRGDEFEPLRPRTRLRFEVAPAARSQADRTTSTPHVGRSAAAHLTTVRARTGRFRSPRVSCKDAWFAACGMETERRTQDGIPRSSDPFDLGGSGLGGARRGAGGEACGNQGPRHRPDRRRDDPERGADRDRRLLGDVRGRFGARHRRETRRRDRLQGQGGKLLGHPIKLIVEDDGCNAEGGQTAATKLAANPGNVVVLGPACSSAARPAHRSCGKRASSTSAPRPPPRR